MIVKTEAICIKNTRYGESSVISKMFTIEHGLSSFIIQGINRKSSTIKPSHIAPGNILELVIYQKPNATIQRVKELKVVTPLLQVHIDMLKSAVLQFMLEIIAKTNEENLRDEIVFNFLRQTICELEELLEDIGNMPLFFLCRYLKFSGWFPNLELWQKGDSFNLKEGRFEKADILRTSDELNESQSRELYEILLTVQNESVISKANLTYRKDLFIALVKYFEFHILKGKRIKSPAVLSEVLA